MIRTGIFGGSFNPIHKGHTALAEQILKQNLVDELWLVVSPQNPLKKDMQLMDDQTRLELAQLAVKNHPSIKVSDFEFHLPRPSYMTDTLKALRNSYPERNFCLIIGADNWLVFDHWFNYQEILKDYSIIVYARQGFPIDPKTLPQNVHLISPMLYPISSTEIRQNLKEETDVSKWLEPEVIERLKKKLP